MKKKLTRLELQKLFNNLTPAERLLIKKALIAYNFEASRERQILDQNVHDLIVRLKNGIKVTEFP